MGANVSRMIPKSDVTSELGTNVSRMIPKSDVTSEYTRHPDPKYKDYILVYKDVRSLNASDRMNYYYYDEKCNEWGMTEAYSLQKDYTLNEYISKFCVYINSIPVVMNDAE
jgi:hypothetical protein